MKFAVSYSGGKESALALYKAAQQGDTPAVLITTYSTESDHSYSHGIDQALLGRISDSLDIPILVVKTSSARYKEDFQDALRQAKLLGAQACVFGDIDIEGHRQWFSELCQNAGLEALFPLWGQPREQVVDDLIDSGFAAYITSVNTKYLSADFLGARLDKETLRRIAACGCADICGENGEYHTIVSDGPIFKHPVHFTFGEKIVTDDCAILPPKADVAQSYKFFSNTACSGFPCHQTKSPQYFNCKFCFCPLYAMGENCGGLFEMLENGVKSCLSCDFSHRPEHYEQMMAKLRGI